MRGFPPDCKVNIYFPLADLMNDYNVNILLFLVFCCLLSHDGKALL